MIHNDEISLITDEPVIAAKDVPHLENLSAASTAMEQALAGLGDRVRVAEKKAFEKGFENGRSAGLEKAGLEISEHLMMLSRNAALQKKELLQSVTQLSMQVVRKIAEEIGPTDMVTAMAETAAREIITTESLAILVHPSVHESVQQRFQKIQHDIGDSAHRIDVRCDDSLQPYDCLLETELGTTVANLEEQLNCLEKILVAPVDTIPGGQQHE